MEGIKQCSNGHFYREDLEKCPFCIDSDNINNQVKTEDNSLLVEGNDITSSEIKINKKRDFVSNITLLLGVLKNKISSINLEEGSFFSFLKKKIFYFHFIIASFSTLILFYLLLIFLNIYTLNGKEFELRNFQSLSVEEMKLEMDLANLKYIITDSVYTDSVPKGTVFTQDPLPGTFVKEGRKIYITVNCNTSQKFSIPDVFNKSEREAVNQLKSHFKIDFIKSQNYSSISSVVTKIKVGDSEVFPGQYLIEGATITLVFGSGRSSSKIVVPNLIGINKQNAVLLLEESRLRVGEIISEGKITDTLTAIILNQRPLSNTKLQSGDMVDIVISQFADTLIINDTINIE